jgi:hypothetical protein
MKVEFSRLISVDRVPDLGSRERLEAEPDECAALAKRFELVALYSFSGLLELLPWRKGGVKVKGTLQARLRQTCVVSLEEFDSEMDVPVERYFMGHTNAGATTTANLESLEDDEPDLIVGNSIDLGELAAECLGIVLDPYPRAPGASFPEGDDAIESPAEKPHPFAGLAKWAEKRD